MKNQKGHSPHTPHRPGLNSVARHRPGEDPTEHPAVAQEGTEWSVLPSTPRLETAGMGSRLQRRAKRSAGNLMNPASQFLSCQTRALGSVWSQEGRPPPEANGSSLRQRHLIRVIDYFLRGSSRGY